MPAGRPTEYKEEYNELAEKVCAVFGADDKKLAKFLGVTKKTIANWKNQYAEFLHSIKRGKDVFDVEHVEASLLERALGYKHDEIKFFAHEGIVTDERTIIKHYPPDVTSLIFWLKNRHPKRWRDIKAIELTGKDGGPVQTQEMPIDLSDFTTEELLVLKKLGIKKGDE